ncbi:MAG: hypothetical protein HQ519_04420, partial [Planctomycetes bacterium]|nr:hypothetical protein [Planctomycetota bacterium]
MRLFSPLLALVFFQCLLCPELTSQTINPIKGLVTRVDHNGAFDESYGNGGFAILQAFSDRGFSLQDGTLDQQGRLVVAGTAGTPDGNQVAVARLQENGSPDPSFGENGIALHTVPGATHSSANAVVEYQGKIIVVGTVEINDRSRTLVICLDDRGRLDMEFDEQGFRVIGFGPTTESSGRDVTISRHGEIYLVSSAFDNSLEDPISNVAVAAMRLDGSFNRVFNGNGRKIQTFVPGYSTLPAGIRVTSNGDILVGGTTFGDFIFNNGQINSSGFTLGQFRAQGNLDLSFGVNGVQVTGFLNTGRPVVDAMELRGREIFLVGTASKEFNRIAIATYGPDGTLNSGFKQNGKVTIPWPSRHVSGRGVQLIPGGDVVVGGTLSSPNQFAASRLKMNGELNTDFVSNGQLTLEEGGMWIDTADLQDVVSSEDHNYLIGFGKLRANFPEAIAIEEMRVELSWTPDHSGVDRIQEFLNAFHSQ